MVKRAERPGRRHLRAVAHPTRRDGAIAIVLLILPWVVALVLLRRHHHLDGGTVGILVAVSLGLPTLWVAWAAYRGPRRAGTTATSLSLAQVADQLAMAVGAQWTAEAAIRRLNDPYPLPVSWAMADASLTDSLDSMVKLAASGAGWPEPPPAGTWAAGPDHLAGEGGDLAEVLARVPTGRLVVLGEPGAGKTMLMVRLVLDLLSRRPGGGPVPFLASLASWNPAEQDLPGWLVAQLLIDHPALAAPPTAHAPEPTQAAALLASRLILPVLDGLDEIPEQVRGSAISRINEALRPGEHVVVTCRTKQYQDALRPEGGIEVTLRAAAAVQLRSLDADTVRDYLCDAAAGPVTRARWDPLLAVLGTEAPAGQALSTPLMVGLARAIYNPRPGELTGTLRDPAELCSSDLADQAAVESLLFDAFIPAAYRHDQGSRWKAQDVERWLVFLACHLERTVARPDLAWWELSRRMGTLSASVDLGLARMTVSSSGTSSVRVDLGLIEIAVSSSGLITFKIGPARVSIDTAARISSAASPKVALLRARRVAIAVGMVFGTFGGILAGVIAGITSGVIAGIVAGVIAWVVAGASGITLTPWGSYQLGRTSLAMERRLPRKLIGFLEDAHRRGVLRQAGAFYQFRHIELQHRLANRGTDRQKPAQEPH